MVIMESTSCFLVSKGSLLMLPKFVTGEIEFCAVLAKALNIRIKKVIEIAIRIKTLKLIEPLN